MSKSTSELCQHPIRLAGRLEELLAELGRRIGHGADRFSLERQLNRVQIVRLELEVSLQKYSEAILYDDLKRSINARLKANENSIPGPPDITANRCEEYFDRIPTASNHIWNGDVHGIPVGHCIICGLPVEDYNERQQEAVRALQDAARSCEEVGRIQ